MHMMVKKRQFKLFALFLLIVFLVPFIPVAPVAADPLPVQVPDFPYGQDSYYNVNNGGFALWQVHGSNYVSYVQTFSPGAIGTPDPIISLNTITYYDLRQYYLDVNYITDTWDIYGNHLDGWPGSSTSNIRVPRPYQDTVDSDVYATLVYCSDDVRWQCGNTTGIYMYMNYMVPGYADPTPTPAPQPSYGELPTFTISSSTEYLDECTLVVKCTTSGTLNGYTYSEGHYYASGASYQNNPWYYYYVKSPHSSYVLYGGVQPYFINPNGNFDMIYTSGISAPRVFSIGYDAEHNIITSGIYIDNVAKCDLGLNSSGYHCYSNYFPIQGVDTWYDGSNNINISDTARFELIACNYGSFRGTGDIVPATPTPTAVPTAIPQPTQNPDPTSTPEPDVKVIEPSDHWWDGLVKPIQYIFVPSQDKMMKTYNTFANKFGVQKPTEFHLDLNALFRPDNVVWDFHPVSLTGEDLEPVEVTLIDFEMVDDWLDSEPGQMIIRIVRAVFGLLMWAYMIYIFRKHIATINYTDAATLMDEDTWKGGDD